MELSIREIRIEYDLKNLYLRENNRKDQLGLGGLSGNNAMEIWRSLK